MLFEVGNVGSWCWLRRRQMKQWLSERWGKRRWRCKSPDDARYSSWHWFWGVGSVCERLRSRSGAGTSLACRASLVRWSCRALRFPLLCTVSFEANFLIKSWHLASFAYYQSFERLLVKWKVQHGGLTLSFTPYQIFIFLEILFKIRNQHKLNLSML